MADYLDSQGNQVNFGDIVTGAQTFASLVRAPILAARMPKVPKIAFTRKTKVRMYLYAHRLGVKAAYYYTALQPVLPAVTREKKIGFRFGGVGVMPLGALPFPFSMYITPSTRSLPIPTFGFGFTAVPLGESRLPFSESRGSSSQSYQQNGGPPAMNLATWEPKKKTGPPLAGGPPITPPGPQGGYGGKTAGGSKKARGRRSPYCWVHKKFHYCRITSKR